MDSNVVEGLIEKLKDYSFQNKRMQDANFSISSVKTFKKYYNEMHLELIKYIQLEQDKQLGEIVKLLKLSRNIFRRTDMWIAMLSISIVFLAILLIYMYYSKVSDILMACATVVVVAVVFLVIRRVQNQPEGLINNLNNNGEVCKEIVVQLQNKNR